MYTRKTIIRLVNNGLIEVDETTEIEDIENEDWQKFQKTHMPLEQKKTVQQKKHSTHSISSRTII